MLYAATTAASAKMFRMTGSSLCLPVLFATVDILPPTVRNISNISRRMLSELYRRHVGYVARFSMSGIPCFRFVRRCSAEAGQKYTRTAIRRDLCRYCASYLSHRLLHRVSPKRSRKSSGGRYSRSTTKRRLSERRSVAYLQRLPKRTFRSCLSIFGMPIRVWMAFAAVPNSARRLCRHPMQSEQRRSCARSDMSAKEHETEVLSVIVPILTEMRRIERSRREKYRAEP